MKRVEVVDPYSGVTLSVRADSVQAKRWGVKAKPEPKRKPKKAD